LNIFRYETVEGGIGKIGTVTSQKRSVRVREKNVETETFGSRPTSVRKKENNRKQAESCDTSFYRSSVIASVRLDNGHPDNGTGCGKNSFHCSIVTHVKNPVKSRAGDSAGPFREAVLTAPKVESGEHSEVDERRGNNSHFPKWNAMTSKSNKDKQGNLPRRCLHK
jgi:hypothetical protein